MQLLHKQPQLYAPSTGVYIHIPFCRRRCHYCDFPVEIIGDRKSTQILEGSKYVNTLLQDIELTFSTLQRQNSLVNNITSVYFGGGTPSLLDTHRKCNILFILFILIVPFFLNCYCYSYTQI